MGKNGGCKSTSVATGLANAHFIGNLNMGFGRLDTYQALQACKLLP